MKTVEIYSEIPKLPALSARNIYISKGKTWSCVKIRKTQFSENKVYQICTRIAIDRRSALELLLKQYFQIPTKYYLVVSRRGPIHRWGNQSWGGITKLINFRSLNRVGRTIIVKFSSLWKRGNFLFHAQNNYLTSLWWKKHFISLDIFTGKGNPLWERNLYGGDYLRISTKAQGASQNIFFWLLPVKVLHKKIFQMSAKTFHRFFSKNIIYTG